MNQLVEMNNKHEEEEEKSRLINHRYRLPTEETTKHKIMLKS